MMDYFDMCHKTYRSLGNDLNGDGIGANINRDTVDSANITHRCIYRNTLYAGNACVWHPCAGFEC